MTRNRSHCADGQPTLRRRGAGDRRRGAGAGAAVGSPGTGKTSVVRALADAAGWPCETVIASIREPADFAGLPVVTGAGADVAVTFAPPAWARRLSRVQRGLLFFDEISTAPPAVQAALLRVVLERTVGDLTLAHDVAIVAAANPPEQAADGWDLSPPLANRFCHLDWPTDARRMAEGFTGGWGHPTVPELPPGWEATTALTRSWVAGFVSVRPPLAVAVPDDATTSGRAWPSPRSWEMAARLLAAATAAGQSSSSPLCSSAARSAAEPEWSSSPGSRRPTCPTPRLCSPTRRASGCRSAATGRSPR